MSSSELTVKADTGVPPTLTALAPAKPLPLIVMTVPPAVLPEAGDTSVTSGASGAANVNWSPDTVEEVPLGVVTVMWTVPADPAGASAVIWISETTVKLLAATPPNETAVAPRKLLPNSVTSVPPAVLPDVGLISATAGAAAAA